MAAMRRIDTEADLAAGFSALIALDPRFEAVRALCGLPPLRRRARGFASLLRLITAQQVSTAAADAIWARVEAAGLTSPEAVRAAGGDALLANGFSRPKARYATAIVAALDAGALDFDRVGAAPDAAALAELTAAPGVGRWTAEAYLLFCEGRPDFFPAADVALQAATAAFLDLPERPTAKALAEIAEAWSPWRGVAARALWAYLRATQGRKGVV